MAKVVEIEAKSALYKLSKRGLPYQWDLNIYRGCSHACAYCYARKSHEYLGNDDFSGEVFVKTNIVEVLEKELSSPSWKPQIINIGGACDAYQEVEKEYRIMPEVLKLMIKYKNPIIISTKSDLIAEDIQLIDELAGHCYVNIAATVTACNASVTEKVELGSSSPEDRIAALNQLGKTKAYTALHFFPILPYLSDSDECLEQMVKWAAEAKVDYMMTGILYLTGAGRKNYLNMIEREFPALLDKYLQLYPKGGANKEYKEKIHGKLKQLREEYQVNSNFRQFLPKND